MTNRELAAELLVRPDDEVLARVPVPDERGAISMNIDGLGQNTIHRHHTYVMCSPIEGAPVVLPTDPT